MTEDDIVMANLRAADAARAAADLAVYGEDLQPPSPPQVEEFQHISAPLAKVLKEVRRKMLANRAAGLL